ncbi:inositol hexakisphosphate and diphosphoinositol-pentakisphosphate kinase 2 isoform X3 [Strongylocentrotus purpuratus]|uniref:Inositol hexakisphosphate and diphosphoinositol-pentakisphosphate kinase n=1 Tax=Strongylocentrotus purpuratus TaxID=7668 RepID=A0A7M7PTU4_STRPU|nr:inositol hexakisphosphate and diphosphoinositol-pentakisphosphate kinase 2 isoform X3 [Strongylocentrotus purpuratus]
MDIPESLTSLNAAGGDERVNFIIGEIPSDAKSQKNLRKPGQQYRYCNRMPVVHEQASANNGLSTSPSAVSGLSRWEAMEIKPKVVVGICCMGKKASSRPMREILHRLEKFEYISLDIFDEDMILNDPVESWPQCNALISFFSTGFPLHKAIEYAKLRKPLVINDLEAQYNLHDRRKVFEILSEEDILVPRHGIHDRDCDPDDFSLIENDDELEIDDVIFRKPFVEKPVSAEDHNVYIYYPSSAGGGSQRLFRKMRNRSSIYSPESRIRRAGSYMYEEFMPTDGTDVKVYTVGPDYAHAEARKSPALDGKVERDSHGKEVRYPVILTNSEKMIARKVCLAFKQTVCGFDLLRASGRSYVCDVNGFSFVKNSNKYYDDCAKILGNMIMRELAPKYNIPWQMFTLDEEIPYMPTTSGTMMELRCVIAVIRHGDRTPKQKMKMEVKHPKFFSLFESYGGRSKGKVKLKRPEQLQKILDVSRYLLGELKWQKHRSQPEIEERESKLEQLKAVLEMYGHFSGINRKVQLKYLPKGIMKHSSSEEGSRKWPDSKGEPSLLLILKWGGELTPAGRVQAEELGRAFRCIYPGGQGDYAGFPGCGLLRLHSTYRHDLKIYASDEGRVQMTAAAFTKGMLALEGELTPILVQMVKSANTSGLLDHEKESVTIQGRVKERLCQSFSRDRTFGPRDFNELAPTGSKSLQDSLTFIKNPVRMCEKVHRVIKNHTKMIKDTMENPENKDFGLYHHETLELMLRRWVKLEKDFKLKSGRFDITKVPDIYDCIKYDMQHNFILKTLGFSHMDELYNSAEMLADFVIPQEYGITTSEKLEIGKGICTPLLKKIRSDLHRINSNDETTYRLNPLYSKGVMSPDRQVRTRLYFTSESHIHTLLSCLRYGGLCDESDPNWQNSCDYLGGIRELNYMTQIVLMLYEDPSKDPMSDDRFRVELHFSPGAKDCEDDENHPGCCPFRSVHNSGNASPYENNSEEDEPSSCIDSSEDDCSDHKAQKGEEQDKVTPLLKVAAKDKKLGGGATVAPGGIIGGKPFLRIQPIKINEPSRAAGQSEPVGTPPSSLLSAGLDDLMGGVAMKSNTGDDHLKVYVPTQPTLPGVKSAPELHDPNWYFNDDILMRRASTYSAAHQGLEHHIQVTSIRPLETLHNSLSLRQVDEFLARITRDGAATPECQTPRSSMHLNTYTPQRVKPSSLNTRESDGSSYYSRSASNPSSNVSSALPSPTESSAKNFDFSLFLESMKSQRVGRESESGQDESDRPEDYFASDEAQHDDAKDEIHLMSMPSLDDDLVIGSVSCGCKSQTFSSSAMSCTTTCTTTETTTKWKGPEIPTTLDCGESVDPQEDTLCSGGDGNGGEVTEEEVSTPCASTSSNASQPGATAFEFPAEDTVEDLNKEQDS